MRRAITTVLVIAVLISSRISAAAETGRMLDLSSTNIQWYASVPTIQGQLQVTPARPPKRPQPHCCNWKAAVIGSSIGAALGAWLTAGLCDAGDCTSAYVRSMGITGGIGFTLGAFAMPLRRHPSRLTP